MMAFGAFLNSEAGGRIGAGDGEGGVRGGFEGECGELDVKVSWRYDELLFGREMATEGFAKGSGVWREFFGRSITHNFVECCMLAGLDAIYFGFEIPNVFHRRSVSQEDSGTDGVIHLILLLA